SLYVVMRKNHCGRFFSVTCAPQRQQRPSCTSSFAKTVLSTGHQFTRAGLRYAKRKLDKNSRRSFLLNAFQASAVIGAFGFGMSRVPFSLNSRSNSAIGRAAFTRGSYHDLYSCKKIHCVQR